MAKPPPTPPPSDIDGVHEDREPIDQPKNSDPDLQHRLKQEQDESKGKPAGASRP